MGKQRPFATHSNIAYTPRGVPANKGQVLSALATCDQFLFN